MEKIKIDRECIQDTKEKRTEAGNSKIPALHVFKSADSFPVLIESDTGSTGIRLKDPNIQYASMGIVYSDLTGDHWYNAAIGDRFFFRNEEARNIVLTLKKSGNVGIGTENPTAKLQVSGLSEYPDNAAAKAAGLTEGAFYRTGDLLKVVH